MDGGQITGMAGWDTSLAAGKGAEASFGASPGQEGGKEGHSKAQGASVTQLGSTIISLQPWKP